MNETTLRSTDKTEIFARFWEAKAKPRAVVLLVHGFKAHSGLYDWAGTELAERGFTTYGLDLRGHGRSAGERLWTDRFGDYVHDVHALATFARQRSPGLPVFLLGHSAGAVISCAYALEHQKDLAGFVSVSLAHQVPAPDFALQVLKRLSLIAPRAHVLRLPNEAFSRDAAFVDRMKADPLIERAGYPTHTVAEMVRADDCLENGDFGKITLPVFILHGTSDRVTKPHGSQRFREMCNSKDKTLRLYEHHFHDLLNDVGKERVVSDIAQWLSARVGR
ncbi:MAG: alpha/beta hydrolase [Polyangiaceae bacterium]|nr:alpha/beta hydrolase [Polyangiaceae bacterium]